MVGIVVVVKLFVFNYIFLWLKDGWFINGFFFVGIVESEGCYYMIEIFYVVVYGIVDEFVGLKFLDFYGDICFEKVIKFIVQM